MTLYIIYIVIGLILLVKGGDFLVDGAVAIAQKAKLSPMVIGLTVVGFGTSAPELLVSTQAAWAGNSGIAIGNVVGSNIANIALILGLTALVRPCPASSQTLRIDTPFMVLSCVLLSAVGYTGTIGRLHGLIGVSMLAIFIGWQIVNSRKNAVGSEASHEHQLPLWKACLYVAVSIAALSYGADLLIDGGSGIARMLGVSDRIIGLTIVAVGTSLPECFASVTAALKGETDMAIGNVIGSVSFNIMSVIGFSAIISPIMNANDGFLFDYSLMTLLAFVLWLFLRTNHLLELYEGMLLFITYIAYIIRTIIIA